MLVFQPSNQKKDFVGINTCSKQLGISTLTKYEDF